MAGYYNSQPTSANPPICRRCYGVGGWTETDYDSAGILRMTWKICPECGGSGKEPIRYVTKTYTTDSSGEMVEIPRVTEADFEELRKIEEEIELAKTRRDELRKRLGLEDIDDNS